MPSKINIFRAFLRELRHGELGDAAGLKNCLFGGAHNNPDFMEAVLPLLSRNTVPVSVDDLLAMPSETFGHVYGSFMKEYALKPFNFSGKYDEWFQRFPIMIRYIRIHDMVHVLLGFDTTLEGELGVYSFVAQQNYSNTLNKAYRTATILYPLLKPKRRGALRASDEHGRSLAVGARILITEPLEDYFGEDLASLRERLLGRRNIA